MSRPRAIHHVNKCVTAQLLYVLTFSSCSLEEFLPRSAQLPTRSSAPETQNISRLEELRLPAGPTNGFSSGRPMWGFSIEAFKLNIHQVTGSWVSSVTSHREQRESCVKQHEMCSCLIHNSIQTDVGKT